MTPEVVIDVFKDAMAYRADSGPLSYRACCRLVVSMFQAATQINEQTLSFLPGYLSRLVPSCFWTMAYLSAD